MNLSLTLFSLDSSFPFSWSLKSFPHSFVFLPLSLTLPHASGKVWTISRPQPYNCSLFCQSVSSLSATPVFLALFSLFIYFLDVYSLSLGYLMLIGFKIRSFFISERVLIILPLFSNCFSIWPAGPALFWFPILPSIFFFPNFLVSTTLHSTCAHIRCHGFLSLSFKCFSKKKEKEKKREFMLTLFVLCQDFVALVARFCAFKTVVTIKL